MKRTATIVEPTLFDFIEFDKEVAPEPTAGLERYAFLYTATSSGNSTGIHFMMSVEDAQAFCSDPRSKGVMSGTYWAYFWTRVSTFCFEFGGNTKGKNGGWILDLRKSYDNGEYDWLVEDLGLKKYNRQDIKSELKQFNVTVLL